jgi:hypothetical protein
MHSPMSPSHSVELSEVDNLPADGLAASSRPIIVAAHPVSDAMSVTASPPAGPCFDGQQPALERVPHQVGLVAHAKLSHEICAVPLDGTDADR